MTWPAFERGISRASAVAGVGGVFTWLAVIGSGAIDLLAAVVLCLVAVVALGFALVWVRHPARMPFWSGTVLFTVLIVPVVWSMVWHESALPRVAQALTVVCLGLSVLMVGRRYDRRR